MYPASLLLESSPVSAKVPIMVWKIIFTAFGNITLLFQVYVAAVVGLEGGVGNIVSRSLIARLVPQDELGKIYGLLAILDASLPFAGI